MGGEICASNKLVVQLIPSPIRRPERKRERRRKSAPTRTQTVMSPPTPKTKRAVHPAAKIYLLAYNALQFFGWSHVLRVTAQCLLYGTSGNELWEQVGPSLSIFQTGALLEIVHSLVGLVPSSVGVTFPQV